MNGLVQTLNNFLELIKLPVIPFIGIMLAVAGICHTKIGGDNGKRWGNGILIGVVICAILVYGGLALSKSLVGSMSFK